MTITTMLAGFFLSEIEGVVLAPLKIVSNPPPRFNFISLLRQRMEGAMLPFDELSGEELEFNTGSNDDMMDCLDPCRANRTSINLPPPEVRTGQVVSEGGRISEECRKDLDSWFCANVWNPYPSDAVLQQFNLRWGLTRDQLKTHFTNVRQRFGAEYPAVKAVWTFFAPLRSQSTYSKNS
jgi:hypothetical protein